MGVRTIVVSDYSGKELKDNTKPTKLTIQPAGVTAKDATVVEIYLSEDELTELLGRIEKGEPIVPKSLPATQSVTKADVAPSAAKERRREAFDRFREWATQQGLTNQQAAEQVEKWLVDNQVEKERPKGEYYDKISPSAQAIAPKVVDAFLAAH